MQKTNTWHRNEAAQTLAKRVRYLIAERQKTSILLTCALILPLLSSSVFFEAWYTTYSEEEFRRKSYIIDHGDGTYSLYIDGQAASIDNSDHLEFERIQMYKKQ